MPDFEDAVVASLAEAAKCSFVVTRNLTDFSGSTVPAIIPTNFLGVIENGGGYLTDHTA